MEDVEGLLHVKFNLAVAEPGAEAVLFDDKLTRKRKLETVLHHISSNTTQWLQKRNRKTLVVSDTKLDILVS